MHHPVFARIAIVFCLLTCLPAFALAQGNPAPSDGPGSPTVQIPMQYDPPRIAAPLVQVSINEGKPENFVLDTGAGYPVCVTSQYAQSAKLPIKAESKIVNGAARLKMAEIKSVELDTSDDQVQPLRPVPALVIDVDLGKFAPGKKVAGIIGISAFGAVPFCLDFKAQQLTLYTSRDAFKLPKTAFTMTPLHLRGGAYEVDINPALGVQTRLLVDTGAPICVLSQAVLTKLAEKYSATTVAQTVEGIYLLEYAVVKSFSVADTHQKNIYATGAPPQLFTLGTFSVVGMQVLRNFRLLWDIPNKQLYWQSNPATRFNYEIADSGASLIRNGTKMRVRRVAKGSPAARAGLRAGDEVLRVDGIATSGEEVAGMESLLNGVVGEEAVLDIKRAGVQTLRFRRTSGFSSSESATPCFEGVTGRVLTGKSLEVFSLKPNAPLFRAGVRAGDTITTINGKEVAHTGVNEFVELIRSQKVTVKLRDRQGRQQTTTVNASPVNRKK